MQVKLFVKYSPRSRNWERRAHWSQWYKEKQKAKEALLSALLSAAEDSSTLTQSPAAAKTCLMGYKTLKLFLETAQTKSFLAQARKRWTKNAKKE